VALSVTSLRRTMMSLLE